TSPAASSGRRSSARSSIASDGRPASAGSRSRSAPPRCSRFGCACRHRNPSSLHPRRDRTRARPAAARQQANPADRRLTMNRLWRGIAIFVLGGVLGTGFGVALGFFIFPYVFPPPSAAEQLTAAERSNLVATRTFIHANPSDPVHYGQGKVSIYDRTVFLEPDFEVGPGPAFHVYLVRKASLRSSSDL